MKEWIVNYHGCDCSLVLTEKGDWGYKDEPAYHLWAKEPKHSHREKLQNLGFNDFDRGLMVLEISSEVAEDLLSVLSS